MSNNLREGGVDFGESAEHRALRAAVAWLTRIALVNGEMILNFVAQHSPGLPGSY